MKIPVHGRLLSVAFWVMVFLGLAPVVLVETSLAPLQAAWADDDDGGGDDDDDDDDGSSYRSDNGQGGTTPPRVTRRQQAPAATPLANFAPEIVVTDLSAADLTILLSEGFTLLERRSITTLGVTLDRLSAPKGLSLDAARDRVRLLPSGADADFNHYYRTAQAQTAAATPACTHENCAAWSAIGWPTSGLAADTCPVTTAIGLIDTGINPDHAILGDARLQLVDRPGAQAPSGAAHGTAIASLLIGSERSRVPGLLPKAQVLAVDVFSRDAGDERADVAALVEGLDLLANRQVRLYNMSLSGPPNSVLSRMIDRMTDPAGLDAVVVAAAGNGGPQAPPAWPAAHPRVIAVTAVDARGRVYQKAQRGDHVTLAAPGVNLLAATSVQGARGKSGTSFAVPFVTAVAAVLMSLPMPQSGAEVRATLAATARDLGPAGRDPIFGYGLVSAAAICP